MRHGSPFPSGTSVSSTSGDGMKGLRDALAVEELFVGVFRRDLSAFYPNIQVTTHATRPRTFPFNDGPNFHLEVEEGADLLVDLFSIRHRIESRDRIPYSNHDLRMIRAIGAVLSLRYQHLFQINHSSRLELYRGGSEDHYVAAFVEPWTYTSTSSRPSRISSTIQTLRTAALSTYENRRVSTGALLLGKDMPSIETPSDALAYGVELTALKSIHRLCDGKRTLFLVDGAGQLVEVIDIGQWVADSGTTDLPDVPCARDYSAHARATQDDGNVCLVLSPNQEIKLFAGGSQVFAFAHGRWRILDPADKYGVWVRAVVNHRLARILFQTALDLAESRQGGLFVVLDQPELAVGRLLASHDVLSDKVPDGPSGGPIPGDPLGKRALHYLARGKSVIDLDPTILEAFAGLDGALVTDRSGRLIAFGAILRHDASASIGAIAEGARTTAAMIASRYGPVLKVSEDGIVTCYLDGSRAWDL